MVQTGASRIADQARLEGLTAAQLGALSNIGWAALIERAGVPDADSWICADAVDVLARREGEQHELSD